MQPIKDRDCVHVILLRDGSYWVSGGFSRDRDEIMSTVKAILELEMPESCWQCPCIQDRTETYRWCGVVGGDCPNPPYEKRRDDCPLKPVGKGGDKRWQRVIGVV